MSATGTASRAGASFKFYYDVVCPFAYMASSVVEGMAERCGATVNWTPVLLGTVLGTQVETRQQLAGVLD